MRDNESEVDPLDPTAVTASNLDLPLASPKQTPDLRSPAPTSMTAPALALDHDLFRSFPQQLAHDPGGRRFWDRFESQGTPPRRALFPHHSSSLASDDTGMDSPTLSASSTSLNLSQLAQSEASRASTPQPASRSSAKRRRDDELDPSTLKRRAVSPGMSVQNSPVAAQSPGQRDAALALATSTPRNKRDSWPATKDRRNSGLGFATTAPLSVAPKRLGLLGMTDTYDGLMKMSIE